MPQKSTNALADKTILLIVLFLHMHTYIYINLIVKEIS